MLRMADQPNIVLFLTDQLRADALGCYGNTICPTPNLDRFAANGMLFDNAFTTSPACSPSRASLMTGNYSHNHGVLLNTHIDPAFSRGLDPQRLLMYSKELDTELITLVNGTFMKHSPRLNTDSTVTKIGGVVVVIESQGQK